MVETRNISLGGLLFHVELPAFSVLNGYLADLKKVLRGSEGKEDILQEVESRLAELFSGFMGSGRTVVTLEDVEKACRQLGEPTEFGDPDLDEARQGSHQEGEHTGAQGDQKQRRMFRDPDDRIIGGVATGLAHRIGVDPVLIRFLAVLLLFLSGPVVVMLYILLWCIIPKARSVSDRVAMKGDPVTVDAIKDTVEDQLKQAREQFDNPHVKGRIRSGWNRFISHDLPQFLKAVLKVLGWFIVFVGVIILLAIGGAIISALVTGNWGWAF
ncbi:MAG: PspC domain-containing protein [Flavobacteriales bacterium]|nr:PspC domain-containing protein [Flavobacteriales bacterium]